MTSRKIIALVEQFALCQINVDVLSGWEARIKTARPLAPEHIVGERWYNWTKGRDAASSYLATRQTFFIGYKQDGEKVEIIRRGWVARGPVVTQMERSGVSGDVYVTYIDADRNKKPRTVKCGI